MSSDAPRPEDRPAEGEHAPAPWHSMRLLDQLFTTDQPTYRAAAQARGAAPVPRARHALYRTFTAVVAVVIGLIMALGMRALRIDTPAADAHRVRLQQAVTEGQERVRQQEQREDELRREIGALQHAGAYSVDSDVNAALVTSGQQAALADVRGPGLVITLDDRHAVDTGADESRKGHGIPPERVQSQDMQLLVNALWGAGAEAISINGHRLTAVSTIRWAVKALIVDFAPLAPPYTINVIGPTEAMNAQLTGGGVEQRLALLKSFGVDVAIRASENVDIAAGSAELYAARPPEESAAPVQGGKP